MFPQRNPVPKKEKTRKCRRVIKRDSQGRVREEGFPDCTPQEMKALLSSRREEEE